MNGMPKGLGTNFGLYAAGVQRRGTMRLGEGLSDRLDSSGVRVATMRESAQSEYIP